MLFVVLILSFLTPIAGAMGYAMHPEYIGVMAIVVAMDAFQAIPFAYLRQQKKAIKFASLKFLFIVLNVGLNLLYFVALPELYKSYPEEVGFIYNPNVGVGYVFYLNLVCTSIIMLCLIPELRGFKWCFDKDLLRRMLKYIMPILGLGLAGILNQTAEKILFPYIYKNADAVSQLGIYGAASKIAMIMAMILQAFRYAYEPFIFAQNKGEDKSQSYCDAMKFFVIFGLLIFLGVMYFLQLLNHFV